MNDTLFPLNVAALTKGQVLDIPELEKIMGIKRTDDRWPWRLLRLKHQIERAREKAGLSMLTMRFSKGTLLVCDDAQAAEYNVNAGRRKLSGFRRAARRNIAVDSTKLSPEQQQQHARAIMRQAMLAAAINGAARRALPNGTNGERVTPRMVTGPTS